MNATNALYTVSFSYQSGNRTIGIRNRFMIVKVGSLVGTNPVAKAPKGNDHIRQPYIGDVMLKVKGGTSSALCTLNPAPMIVKWEVMNDTVTYLLVSLCGQIKVPVCCH